MDDIERMEQQMEAAEAGETMVVQVTTASALDIALVQKTDEEQIRILKATVSRGLDKDDPVLDIYNAAEASARAAHASATASLRMAESMHSLPGVVQKAAIGASGEVAGQINAVLAKKIPDFGSAIKVGVMAGVEDAVASVNSASKKLADAASRFDNDVDKTVIARRDAVLASWVQSGSDSLEKRMSEAVKRERIFNVYLLLFLSGSMFVGGIVLGMHLHF